MDLFNRDFKGANFGKSVYIRPLNIYEQFENIVIDFKVFLKANDRVVQNWRTMCHKVEDYRIVAGEFHTIDHYNDHPLLWEYHHPQQELSFTGDIEQPAQLVGELYDCHHTTVDGWIEFHHYLNAPIASRLIEENGLVAKGPAPLMEAYQRMFEAHSVETTMTQVAESEERYEVLVFGQSYIICKGVKFKRL